MSKDDAQRPPHQSGFLSSRSVGESTDPKQTQSSSTSGAPREGAHTITIREAEAQDHGAWLGLWLGYQSFYQAEIDTLTTHQTWSRMIDPAFPMWCDLAIVNGKAVGLVHSHTHRSTWTLGDYCYLQDLFVEPRYRACGLGRALIERVYERARDLNCARVWWLTHESNRAAMRLYDKIADRSGFVHYRRMFL